jgi:hypothetical protein
LRFLLGIRIRKKHFQNLYNEIKVLHYYKIS